VSGGGGGCTPARRAVYGTWPAFEAQPSKMDRRESAAGRRKTGFGSVSGKLKIEFNPMNLFTNC
jgi:hypothetical protein